MADDSRNTEAPGRLGLIAGGGDLPLEIAAALADRNPFVIRVRGFAETGFETFEHVDLSVGQIGGMVKALRKAECTSVCFAGYVSRPDLKSLKMDARGLAMVPKALAAGRSGDDALIRVVVSEFESAGFAVVGADEVLSDLRPAAGWWGKDASEEIRADIDKALVIAREIGALDIGQGAVVCDGVVLAVEAQEGTEAMLARVADLPETLRGTVGEPRGILAKVPKPIQERRVDLPTIGPDTVASCAEAGLAGIALEAGSALVVNKPAVLDALEETGLFIAITETTP